MVWLTFLPAPEGQPVKRLRRQIHGAKQEKLNRKEEGSHSKYEWENLRTASLLPETRTYGTDSPSRQKPCALSITPLHHLQKRRLNDRLPAHMIPSTQESLEDVYTYTWHTKSMVWLTFFSTPGGQPVKRLRHQIHGAKQEKLLILRKNGVRIYTNGKIPEGQGYMPRVKPSAPIRLADRNHAHYPSRHCTIFKKRRLNDGLPAHMIPSTRESSEDAYTYTYQWRV